MRFCALILLFGSLAAAAWASPAGRGSGVRLTECDTEGRSATFQGHMGKLKRARALQMLFVLETRTPTAPRWTRVAGVWGDVITRNGPYRFDRRVDGLVVGADYRAFVRFRWRNKAGAVVARAEARSRPCRQPDTRANLQAERITQTPGPSPETRIYSVRVVNVGQAEAPPFLTRLELDQTDLGSDDTALALAPGQGATLEFEGPPCASGSILTATVDVKAEVDEADESDNVLMEPCPAARRPAPQRTGHHLESVVR